MAGEANNPVAVQGSSFDGVLKSILSGELYLAIGVITILAILLAPMPTALLDISLAASISFSVLILMTALFIQRPLEFSAFPTVLLIATMSRLALNLATTRLILTEGHTGTGAAGHVIEAFGKFVMRGDVLVGIIVFSILVIVNFVVITKGSGRIAEVAARFTLDAMPGKQMAIDADLSSGLINEDQARLRRRELEEESNFFGAMDGASKFVRGDAIAGLLITVINIMAGIVIGTVNKGMDFGHALETYTILTVGDGLVTQVPALIVSTAAGLLVSKAGIEGAADKALLKQFSRYPQGLGLVSAVIFLMGFLPGLPTIWFMAISAGAGTLAWRSASEKPKAAARAAAEKKAKAAAAPSEEPISSALALDHLRLELGYGLLPLINDVAGHRLTDQIKALRRQLATEMGFVMPAVRILDNMQLPSNAYAILVKELNAGRGELQLNHFLAMDPRGGDVQLNGTRTREPAFGLPATWIESGLREEAEFRGYTVVDPATVLTTHLTEILRSNMAELLSYAETRKLLDDLPKDQVKIVEDIVPSQISVSGVQRVLQTLLRERISIRDLSTILEGIAEASAFTQNITTITEHVRARLARQITFGNTNNEGILPIISLSPKWEKAFSESLVGQGEDRQLAMAPSALQEFITLIRDRFEEASLAGETPVLLTSPLARPFVRSLIERIRPQTTVISQNEVHPQVRLRTTGQI
ncbi:MAG: flagellar biosynthesis protein FlhA [Alphaproteobacteria bacterium]